MASAARKIVNDMADGFAPVSTARMVGRMIASTSQNHGTAGASGKPGTSGSAGLSGENGTAGLDGSLIDITSMTTASPARFSNNSQPSRKKVDFNIQVLTT